MRFRDLVWRNDQDPQTIGFHVFLSSASFHKQNHTNKVKTFSYFRNTLVPTRFIGVNAKQTLLLFYPRTFLDTSNYWLQRSTDSINIDLKKLRTSKQEQPRHNISSLKKAQHITHAQTHRADTNLQQHHDRGEEHKNNCAPASSTHSYIRRPPAPDGLAQSQHSEETVQRGPCGRVVKQGGRGSCRMKTILLS